MIAGALPVLAQDRREQKGPKNHLKLEAWNTEAQLEKDGTLVVLLGEAHIAFQSLVKKDAQFLEVRADNAVAFVPSESELRNEGAPAIRALYAEGHVRLAQRMKGAAPFVLEADQLWLDLVGERAYAVNAIARMPGSKKPKKTVGPNPRSSQPGAASFALRAKKLRLEGTDVLIAEGAAFSACPFGLPHEALEATRITIVEAHPDREPPAALAVAAALGDVGGAAIARKAERDLPFRAFRDITRRRVEPREGSDAIFHSMKDPRFVSSEDAALRVRPPFLGEEGVALPFPVPLAWETDWPFPDIRVGQSSRFGWFEKASIKLPILRHGILHDSKDKHVKDGLDLDVKGGGAFYEQRGGSGEGGAQWQYLDDGKRAARGSITGTYIHDRAPFDRNGAPVPDEDRYWVRGVHQQDLPLGVHVDTEVSKLSDRNYLREWERSAALTQKEQETYIYARRTWDDLGARIDGRWRLNGFQNQVEDLPRARLDWLLTPVFTPTPFGGLYFTAKTEVAHFRRRFDDALRLPDERLVREDLEGRLDYKASVADKIYLRAYGSGRFTDWSKRQNADGTTSHDSVERFMGTVGGRVGTQFDAPFVLSDSGFTLRHVLIPEVGYENRLLDTRDPATLVQIDEVDTYRPGAYVYGRLRNRLQWAHDPSGKGSKELLDVILEARYFPTNERLAPQQQIWGTVFSDARLYLGSEGTLRAIAEVDPNRHRLLRLDTTFTWLASRSVGSWLGEPDKVYPDISVDVGFHELADLSRFVGWGVDARFTPSWGARFEQLYDIDKRDFLRHRLIVRRYFHSFAFELTGSWDPILKDTRVSFAVVPFFEDTELPAYQPLDFTGQ